MNTLPVGFTITNPGVIPNSVWEFIDKNFTETCPSETHWTFYAKHEGAKKFIVDVLARHHGIVAF